MRATINQQVHYLGQKTAYNTDISGDQKELQRKVEDYEEASNFTPPASYSDQPRVVDLFKKIFGVTVSWMGNDVGRLEDNGKKIESWDDSMLPQIAKKLGMEVIPNPPGTNVLNAAIGESEVSNKDLLVRISHEADWYKIEFIDIPKRSKTGSKASAKGLQKAAGMGLIRVAGNMFECPSSKDFWRVDGDKVIRVSSVEVNLNEKLQPADSNNPDRYLEKLLSELEF